MYANYFPCAVERYENRAAVDWMRDALVSLGSVPDLPSDLSATWELGVVPVLRSKVYLGIMQSSGGPLFVPAGASSATVALNPNNLHYAYAADYARFEASVADAIDVPDFKGSIERSLRALCRSATRDTFVFRPRPDPRQLYKLLIKLVLLRQLTESPFMAAQYREALRYGAQQSAFRSGVVNDARASLLTLIDATAGDHDRKVDAQNASDRAAASLLADRERRSRDDADAADRALAGAAARRAQSELDMQRSVAMSEKLASDTREVIAALYTANVARSEADRRYDEAKTFSMRVVKSQEQALWERNGAGTARKRWAASSAMVAQLEAQLQTVHSLMRQTIAQLEDEARTAAQKRADTELQTADLARSVAAADATVAALRDTLASLREAYNELVRRYDDAVFQMDADQRELDAMTAQARALEVEPADPTGELGRMKTQLQQTTANAQRYADETQRALLRDAKNRACVGAKPDAGNAAPGNVPAPGNAPAPGKAPAPWTYEYGIEYKSANIGDFDLGSGLSTQQLSDECRRRCTDKADCAMYQVRNPDTGAGKCWLYDAGQRDGKTLHKTFAQSDKDNYGRWVVGYKQMGA